MTMGAEPIKSPTMNFMAFDGKVFWSFFGAAFGKVSGMDWLTIAIIILIIFGLKWVLAWREQTKKWAYENLRETNRNSEAAVAENNRNEEAVTAEKHRHKEASQRNSVSKVARPPPCREAA
jgi:hypothetical protein